MLDTKRNINFRLRLIWRNFTVEKPPPNKTSYMTPQIKILGTYLVKSWLKLAVRIAENYLNFPVKESSQNVVNGLFFKNQLPYGLVIDYAHCIISDAVYTLGTYFRSMHKVLVTLVTLLKCALFLKNIKNFAYLKSILFKFTIYWWGKHLQNVHMYECVREWLFVSMWPCDELVKGISSLRPRTAGIGSSRPWWF